MSYVQPGISLILILMVYGLFRERRRNGSGHLILVVATGLLLLWSWMPVAWLFSASLERYPSLAEIPLGSEALVVLGGGSYPSNPSIPVPTLAEDSYTRCRYASWLYRKSGVPLTVITSGGIVGAGVSGREVALAKLMADELVAQGVPLQAIVVEPVSQSTFENAVNTARLLRSRGIRRVILVTSGAHMPRAERCFRRQGIEVTAAPCCMYTKSRLFDGRSLIPAFPAMRQNEAILHEWIGLMWYWLSGRA